MSHGLRMITMTTSAILLLTSTLGAEKTAPPRGCSLCPGMTWVKKDCQLFFFFAYEPTETSDINELPEWLLKKARRHLINRLGGDVYSRLSFRQAQVVDVDEYYRLNPDWDRIRHPIHAYDLHFLLGFKDEGPVEYCAQIKFDAQGNILTDIDLPVTAKYPERARVLPLQEVLDLAESLGVPLDEAYLEMKYDEPSDTLEYLVWYLIDSPQDGNNRITLHVKAHDPRSFYWSKSRMVAELWDEARPNYRMQPSAGVAAARNELALALARLG